MKKVIIPLLIIVAVLAALDIYAFKGLAQPFVELHRRETLGAWFTGGVFDWIGLFVFHVIAILFIIGTIKDADYYEEVGSSALGIIFFVVLPISALLLIYIA